MKNKKIFVLAAAMLTMAVTGCAPEAQSYKLTIDADQGVESVEIYNGETEVSDLTHIAEGTELSAVITLKDDYETTAVTLGDADLLLEDGRYDFIMPSMDATLEVVTAEIINSYKLTVTKDDGIDSVKVFNGTTEITDFSKIAEGTELTVEVTAKEGYGVSEVKVGSAVLTAKDGKYSFAMPEKDETLSVTSLRTVATITVTNDDTKGSVALTAGGSAITDGKVNIGTKVKLVVTVTAEHTFVKDLTVNGETVAYPEGGYEFDVTANAYEITVNYAEEHAVNYSVIGLQAQYMFTMSVVDAEGEAIADGAYVLPGSDYDLVLTASSGAPAFSDQYLSQLYIHVGDTVIRGEDEKAVVAADGSTLTYTFAVEDEDVDIYALYNSSKDTTGTGVGVSFVENENIKVLGFVEGDKYSANYLQIPFVKLNLGYVVTGVSLEFSDGTTKDLTIQSEFYVNDNGTDGIIGIQAQLTGDVKITIKGEVKAVHKITYEGAENVTVGYGSLPESAIVDSQVSCSSITAKDSSKTLVDIEITGVPESDYYVSGYDGSCSFTIRKMPDNDVTIKFVFVDNGTLTVEHDEHVTGYKVTNASGTEIESLAPGASIQVHFTLEEGYLIESVVDADGTSYSVIDRMEEVYYYPVRETVRRTFIALTMPEDGADIAFTVKTVKGTVLKVQESADYTATIGSGLGIYIPATTVEFSGSVTNKAKTVESIALVDADGGRTNIEFTLSGSSFRGQFVVPAGDATLVVTLKDIASKEVGIEVVNNSTADDLSAIFSTFSINNRNSSVSIYQYKEEFEKVKLLENSQTTLSFGVKGNYSVSACFVKEDGSVVEFPLTNISSSGESRYFAYSPLNFSLDYKTLRITVSDMEALDFAVNTDKASDVTQDEISLAVNGGEATAITSPDLKLYAGDSVSVNITKEAEAGYAYVVTLLDADGEEISQYNGRYTILGYFTIVVEKVQAYKVNIDIDSTLSRVYVNLFSNGGDTYRDDQLFYKAFDGYINVNSWVSDIDLVVKVGGTDVLKTTVTGGEEYYSETINFNGDIEITVTPHVADEAAE